MTAASRQVAWDVYEEHLDEATFLWGRWEDALVAANYTLAEVIDGPEARLLAHLDGLVLGGRPVADKLLLPALSADESGRIAVAAWVLVQTESGADYQDAVIEAMVKADTPARDAIARALGLGPRVDLSRLMPLWNGGSPSIRGAVFDIMRTGEATESWVRQHLEAVLRGGDSIPRAAALRALRQAPDRALVACIDEALKTELREVRREAITTGVVFSLPAAWDACRRAAIRAGDGCRLPLALLASSPRAADRAVVVALARDAKVKRHAVWALGFAGDLNAMDALIEATADPVVARIAGEALSATTGVVLEGSLVTRGDTKGPDAREVGADDPPPVVRTDDHLPLPNAPVIKKWWQAQRARFAPGIRHIFGRPRDPDALRAALGTASMWRREVIWLELAIATGEAPAVNVRTWAGAQRRALATAAPAAAAARAR